MISVSQLGKSFGPQTLFSGVSMQLNAGARYGLVGANGSGKSTLLRIFTGEELSSEGTVSIPKRLRLGVLKQDHFQYEDVPIADVVMMGHEELWQAMEAKEAILANADQEFDADRYADLEDVILRHDGYSMESRAGEILEGLGIATERHRDPLSSLSGGFKLRVLLAQTLASGPEALLLDEPTNHLDILSIRWLEKFLVGYTGLVVVVSHDHRFLDNVCTHIVDVDYETAILYTGNYQAFVLAKKEERDRKEAEIAKQEKEIAGQRAFIERFKAKATKARQAQSKLKKVEKMNVTKLPTSSRRWPKFRFQACRPSGKQVLEIEDISKSYDDNQVLHDVSLTIDRGDRVAVIGPNGIGKSTLLKIIMDKVAADAGEVTWGYETHPGYFAQDHKTELGNPRGSVESWLWDFCPGEPIGFVRGNLGLVLFSGDEVEKKLGSLSGGEAARLVFARLSVQKPNVLILDEPTNHLDIESIESLVKGLRAFDGTLIFVSHDRWFVSKLANRIVEITPNGLGDHRGTYEEYVEKCGDDHLDAEVAALQAKREKRRARSSAPPVQDNRASRKKLSKLKKRRDAVTAEIEKAEKRIGEINELFCDPGYFDRTAPEKVRKVEAEQKRLSDRIEGWMAEWEGVETKLAELSDD